MIHLFYLFILLRIGNGELDQNEPNWTLLGTKDRDNALIRGTRDLLIISCRKRSEIRSEFGPEFLKIL